MTIIELVLALLAILAAAFFFTNAVEMLGERLNLGQGAVGSVLAAVGTALPETMIPIVAILGAVIVGTGGSAAGEIGIGAILGAPFLLSTLAIFVVGAAAIGFRGRRSTGDQVVADRDTGIRDVGFFLVCFTVAAGAGLLPLPLLVKILLAIALVGAYVFYVTRTIKSDDGGELEDTPENLKFWPFSSTPPTWAVVGQLVISLGVMAAGAHFFVVAVEHGSKAVGIPAGLVALILAPLATELPEKLNSVIWLRDNKDTLALGNITGAMVFQSTIPVSIGILFTPWQLDSLSALASGLAVASGIVFFVLLLRNDSIRAFYLLGAGSLYIVFIGVAIYSIVLA